MKNQCFKTLLKRLVCTAILATIAVFTNIAISEAKTKKLAQAGSFTLMLNKDKNMFECKTAQQGNIDIRFIQKSIDYEYGEQTNELGSLSISHGGAYGLFDFNRNRVQAHVTFDEQYFEKYDIHCIMVNKIKFKITSYPVIYISRDLKHARCRNAVKDHEHKHNDVHVKIMKMYTDKLRDAAEHDFKNPQVYALKSADKETYKDKIRSFIDAFDADNSFVNDPELRAEWFRLQAEIDDYGSDYNQNIYDICNKYE